MRTRILTAVLLGAIALEATPVLVAQRQGGPNPTAGRFVQMRITGTAAIRGRVVAADTGTPVRRAQIRASMGGGQSRLASTDAEGRFELRDLPAGKWTLAASKPGFVTQRFGQRRAFETVAPIELADAQRFDAANFSLARGGAITGRVVDDFGDPVANARVQVLRSRLVSGRRRLTPVGSGDESDDTGAFRLYGLPPGEYLVSARLRVNPIETSSDQTSYAPTYFPGTGNVVEAQRITLRVSEEQHGISFALQPVRTVRVSGAVVSATGGPLDGGVVALSSAVETDEATLDTQTAGRILPDGSFTILNVAPGSYLLSVRTGFGRGGRGALSATDFEAAIVPLVVGSDDVSGLSVTTTKGASIEGTVVLEGTAAPPTLGNLQIRTRALRGAPGMDGGRSARVSADGTFRLPSLIGPHAITVDGVPPQWTVKSIFLNGADVVDTPLEFRGTEQITDARVVLTDRVTEVNGTVSLGNQTARDFSVVLFAEENERWTFPSRYVWSARGDQKGSYSVRGMPSGVRYLAVAVDYLEDGEFQDPEFLARMREKATSFSLTDGESKKLDLRLIER